MFKRWAICFLHDSSPLDQKTYTHKAKAEKELTLLTNKTKLVVKPVEIKVL